VAENLAQLAEQHISLSSQLEGMRRAMLACLTNGATGKLETPFSQPAGSAGGREPAKTKQYPDRETVRANSAAQDEAVLAMLKSQPEMRPAQSHRPSGQTTRRPDSA
jgi:hypothetical protein